MKKSIILILVLSTSIVFSCSKSNENVYVGADYSESTVSASAPQQTEESVNISTERKVIKQGEVKFETGNVDKTKNAVLEAIQGVKGYVSKENNYTTEERKTQSLTVRIPADKFDVFMKAIDEIAGKYDVKNIDVLDVTEEFIDVEARMNTKKELENRYRELLKSAKNIQEMLAIESEIAKIRGEIESVEGRLRYLKDNISYSTLNIEYYQKLHTSFGFFSKVKDGFYNGWELLLRIFIGISHIWAILLVLIIGIIFYKKRKQKKQIKK